ncbi:hypothetical protein B484DRAFT_456195 [Ochromonadaceae sp. CCMP2298]|nr:hypothetical protein B484DRAFT_456195 [Ochromonadaceae sp. CCMP2298]|mmetsp:Transcript_17604/g.38321  ORF Transcript_17604/g.38321 Transcript_17604/m.38321 type:complete len:694 (-) Transcript_17604:96-2177(-)
MADKISDAEAELPKDRAARFFERSKQLSLVGSSSSIETERILKDIYRAMSFNPNQVNHYLFLGKIYQHSLDITSAIFCYRLVLNQAPAHPSANKHLCDLLVVRGQELMATAAKISSLLKFHQARAHFDEALLIDKERRQAWIFKCICHVHASELTDAFEAISRAFKVQLVITAEMLILRSKIYWGRGLTEQGNADMRIAATMDKNHPDVVSFFNRSFVKAEALYKESVREFTAGRYKESLLAVNHAIHITTEDVKLLMMQSKLHRMLGQLQQAYDAMLRAKSIFERAFEGTKYPMELPSDITLQINLILNDMSVDYAMKGEYDKALMLLNKIVKSEEGMNKGGLIKPNHKFYLNRGDCYRALGLLQDAIEDYTRAHVLQPEDWEIRTRLSLSHYLIGTQHFNKHQYQQTERELTRAISFNPKVSEYYVVRGKTLYYQSQFQQSYVDFKQALALNPHNEEVRELLAQFDDEVRSPKNNKKRQGLEDGIVGAGGGAGGPEASKKSDARVDFSKLPRAKEVEAVLKLRVTDEHLVQMMLQPRLARELPVLRMLGKSKDLDRLNLPNTRSSPAPLPVVRSAPRADYPFDGAMAASQDLRGKNRRLQSLFRAKQDTSKGPLWLMVETAKDIAWAKSHPEDENVHARLKTKARPRSPEKPKAPPNRSASAGLRGKKQAKPGSAPAATKGAPKTSKKTTS